MRRWDSHISSLHLQGNLQFVGGYTLAISDTPIVLLYDLDHPQVHSEILYRKNQSRGGPFKYLFDVIPSSG